MQERGARISSYKTGRVERGPRIGLILIFNYFQVCIYCNRARSQLSKHVSVVMIQPLYQDLWSSLVTRSTPDLMFR
jgi:hypothetical protein